MHESVSPIRKSDISLQSRSSTFKLKFRLLVLVHNVTWFWLPDGNFCKHSKMCDINRVFCDLVTFETIFMFWLPDEFVHDILKYPKSPQKFDLALFETFWKNRKSISVSRWILATRFEFTQLKSQKFTKSAKWTNIWIWPFLTFLIGFAL